MYSHLARLPRQKLTSLDGSFSIEIPAGSLCLQSNYDNTNKKCTGEGEVTLTIGPTVDHFTNVLQDLDWSYAVSDDRGKGSLIVATEKVILLESASLTLPAPTSVSDKIRISYLVDKVMESQYLSGIDLFSGEISNSMTSIQIADLGAYQIINFLENSVSTASKANQTSDNYTCEINKEGEKRRKEEELTLTADSFECMMKNQP